MKMKKTCFQHKRWALVSFVLLDIFGWVGVFSASAQMVLNGAVGGNVTFPTQLTESGSIIYKEKIIGQVFNNQAKSFREFKDRLHWNDGFFILLHLRTEDSGVYTVDNTEEERKEVYYLDVYEKVSEPKVTTLDYDPPESELCSLQCSVRIVGGLNLSWLKGSVILNHTNSSSPDDTLKLPLEIQQLDKGTYSCVASNPVSKQMTTVNSTELCNPKIDNSKKRLYIIAIVCSVVFVLVVIAMTIFILMKIIRRSEDSSATEGLQDEVQYSVITHKKHAQGNIREPVSQETCQLTTVYDQIRPHQPGNFRPE